MTLRDKPILDELIAEGISIFSIGHPIKANLPIDSTVDGIIICFNDEHLSNACDSIDFKDELFSNKTSFKDEHSQNAFISIISTVDGIEIFDKDLHWLNEYFLILFKEGGIIICSNDSHFWNAYDPIYFNVEGNIICFNFVQQMNEL